MALRRGPLAAQTDLATGLEEGLLLVFSYSAFGVAFESKLDPASKDLMGSSGSKFLEVLLQVLENHGGKGSNWAIFVETGLKS